MTTLVRYEGRIVATVGATRIYLAPEVERLPDGDAVLRFVVMMGAFALDAIRASRVGYTDERARAVARHALMERQEFQRVENHSDAEIAAHFGVPEAEVRARRTDLRTGATTS